MQVDWLNALPAPLYWLCVAGIGTAVVFLLGVLCALMGTTFGFFPRPSETVPRWLARITLGCMFVGVIAALSLGVMFAPFLALTYFLEWSYGHALLVGLPTGLIVMVAGYLAYEWRG